MCLEEAGFPPESLVRMLIYTTDVAGYRAELKPIGRIYREVFGRHYPAMALLGINELFDPKACVDWRRRSVETAMRGRDIRVRRRPGLVPSIRSTDRRL